ncbi:MAG TPA: hypothetical protein VLA19_32835 [Herpetosiphonaceae bacterium]|nr:hypothetical protein [Herpetosiphonaceae bacterium]
MSNEESAIKAALNGNAANADLREMGVFKADGTLNENHALLSALRGRLPLADQDQPPVLADALRTEFERPPFGWDGNTVRVGLALLLRESGCRLIENSQILADPNDPNVVAALTREQRFRGLRVQGLRTEIGMPELLQLRGYVDTIWGVRPALVPATLNTVLGDKLAETMEEAQAIKSWAETAQCQLPVPFESGTIVVGDLLNNATVNARLPRFLEQADTVLHYTELLQQLAEFRRSHGAEYGSVRDFFNRMLHLDADQPELRRFIDDWRMLTRERSFTDPARWNELVRAYRDAQAAVEAQASQWKRDARERLEEIDQNLERRAREAGVPEEDLEAVVATLRQIFRGVRERLAQPDISYYEAKGLLTALTDADLQLRGRLRELQGKYRVTPRDHDEVHLHWKQIVSHTRIVDADDLRRMLEGIEAAVQRELDQKHVVIIE